MDKEYIYSFVELLEKRDHSGIMECLHDEAVVKDPHFPKVKMTGKKEINRGLSWSFSGIKKSRLKIKDVVIDDSKAYVEIDTEHDLKIGLKYRYSQLLKIELKANKIQSIQTYVTYPPKGLRGLLRFSFSLMWYLEDEMEKGDSKYLSNLFPLLSRSLSK